MNNLNEPNEIDEDIMEEYLTQNEDDEINENLDGLQINSGSKGSFSNHTSLVSNGSALVSKDVNNLLNRLKDSPYLPNSSESPSGHHAYNKAYPFSENNYKTTTIPLNDTSISSSDSLRQSSVSTTSTSFSKLSIEKANTLIEGRVDKSQEIHLPDLTLPIIRPSSNRRSNSSSLLSNPKITHNLGSPGVDPLHVKSTYNHKYDTLLKKPEFIIGERVQDYSLPINLPEPLPDHHKYVIRRKSLMLSSLVNSNNLELFQPEEFVKQNTRDKSLKSTLMVDAKNAVEREENHKQRMHNKKSKQQKDQAIIDKRLGQWEQLTVYSPLGVDLGKSFDRTVYQFKKKDYQEKAAMCKTVSTAREKQNNEIRDTLNKVNLVVN